MMKIHDFHFSYIMNNETLVCLVSNTANMCVHTTPQLLG